MRDLIIVIVFGVLYFLSWIVVHLVCTHKYFFCNKNCKRCKNWKCKQYAFRPVVTRDENMRDVHCCRACGNQVDLFSDAYCCKCGHKVDWDMTSAIFIDEFWENAKR